MPCNQNDYGAFFYYHFFIMKSILIILFTFLSISTFGQINFSKSSLMTPIQYTDFNATDIGDVNNDGKNDLVVISSASNDTTYKNCVLVFIQKTDGTLIEAFRLKFPHFYSVNRIIQVIDMNNDKRNDILIGYGTNFGIWYQQVDGTFDSLKLVSIGSNAIYAMKAGDLNNDGLMDVAVSRSGTSSMFIFTQTTQGLFSSKTVYMPTYAGQIEIGDVNGDQLNDVVSIMGNAAPFSSLQITYQTPTNGLADTALVYSYMIPKWSFPNLSGISIADMDNDGRNDIIGTKSGNIPYGNVLVFYQDSNGKIGNRTTLLPSYDLATPVKTADFNCDGRMDILVGNNAWSKISCYEQKTDGLFSDYKLFPNNYYCNPYSIATGDLNSDGKKDVVSVGQNAEIVLFTNISKPTVFYRIDTTVVNIKMVNDTLLRVNIERTVLPDSSGKACKTNREWQKKITIRTEITNIQADSLFLRYAELCGSAYKDTIAKKFSLQSSRIISIDTTSTLVNTDFIRTDATDGTVPAEYISGNIYLYANICWTLNVDQDWLTVDTTNGNGFYKLFVTIQENKSFLPRTAHFTFSGDGVPDVVLTIVQEGIKPFIDVAFNTLTFKNDGKDSIQLNVFSNISWKIISEESWLHLNKKAGKLNDSIVMTAEPNLTETERFANFSIVGDSSTVHYIQVSQSPATNLFITKDIGLVIYSKPESKVLQFRVDSKWIGSDIEICSLDGRVVLRSRLIAQSTNLDINRLTKGHYIIRISSSEGSLMRKFLIE